MVCLTTAQHEYLLAIERDRDRLAELVAKPRAPWTSADVSDEQILDIWDRVSGITDAGKRRLAFGREILELRSVPFTDQRSAS